MKIVSVLIPIAAGLALGIGAAAPAHADPTPDPGDVPGVVITDQPPAPDFTDNCVDGVGQVVVPGDLNNVAYYLDDYRVDGVGQVLVDLFTYADNSFGDGIQTSWSRYYTENPCDPVPDPAPPTPADPTTLTTPAAPEQPGNDATVAAFDAVPVIFDGSQARVAFEFAHGLIQ